MFGIMVSLLACTPQATPEGVERVAFVMGTTVRVEVVDSDPRGAARAAERAIAELRSAERRLSSWRPDSEISRWNRSPVGAEFPLSERTAAELGRVEHWSARTSGAVDPRVGPLIDLWNLRGSGREVMPSDDEVQRALLDVRGMRIDGAHGRRSRRDAWIDTGAFGKGAALDLALAAVTRVAPHAEVHLDLGGQHAWRRRDRIELGISHPTDRERVVARVGLAPGGSVATSGNSERGVIVAGRRCGHLLDPRSGRPARDFGSVTVVADSALDADCLATALFVLGPDRAIEFAEATAGVEVVVVESDRSTRIRASSGLARSLTIVQSGPASAAPAFPSTKVDD